MIFVSTGFLFYSPTETYDSCQSSLTMNKTSLKVARAIESNYYWDRTITRFVFEVRHLFMRSFKPKNHEIS